MPLDTKCFQACLKIQKVDDFIKMLKAKKREKKCMHKELKNAQDVFSELLLSDPMIDNYKKVTFYSINFEVLSTVQLKYEEN